MQRLLVWGVSGIFLAAVVWSVYVASGLSFTSGRAVLPAEAATGWSKGPEDAKLVLVEYGDFQCPACAQYAPMLSLIASELHATFKIVYKHFPLGTIHKHADLAARAAEAAGLQGKFWEMHDLLYQNQETWAMQQNPISVFAGYASLLKLNLEKFNFDFNSPAVQKKINDDFAGGLAARVDSTPTFFLNGKKIKNPRTYEEFSALVKKAVAETLSQ